MKQTDLRILAHLRNNARASITGISRKTGIPVSTIFDRIRVYENQLVHKFTALIDFSKLGFNVRANIFLKVELGNRSAISKLNVLVPKSIIAMRFINFELVNF